MTRFSPLFERLEQTYFKSNLDHLKSRIDWADSQFDHGDKTKWESILHSLPDIAPSSFELNHAAVTIGSRSDISPPQNNIIEGQLRQLHPWRKGPFQIFNTFINSEWRSDLKWNRLISHISPLKGKRVLDVGSGNGYHCWRARGEGADLVLGIEPYRLYNAQFHAVKTYLTDEPVFIIPLAMQSFPEKCESFDTVFSMGVLYHVRSPFDHLLQLKGAMKAGGELILETLVVDGDVNTVFTPKTRYAKMRNVWFIPSALMLERMLQRTGFTNIQLANLNRTTSEEQRTTDWMTFESLTDFLSPDDPQKTVEGYPAPVRAIFIAATP